jgi:hypothetical protein
MRIQTLVWPQDRTDHIDRHGVTPEEVEEPMNASRLPQSDSIRELADCWDTHNVKPSFH